MRRGLFLPLCLVGMGIFLLLDNLGLIHFSVLETFAIWWPLLLIVVGVALYFTPNRIGVHQKGSTNDKDTHASSTP